MFPPCTDLVIGAAGAGAADPLSALTGALPIKARQLDALTGLLGGLGGAAKPAGGAAGAGAANPLTALTGALPIKERQLDALTGLLGGLGGGAKPAGGAAGATDPLAALTGALPIKVKERSDGSLDILAAM